MKFVEYLFWAFIIGFFLFVCISRLLKPKQAKRRLPKLTPPGNGRKAAELQERLKCSLSLLRSIPICYQEFTIPKRSGGQRVIQAPSADLKKLQRTILHQLLGKLKSHPTAMGFEKNSSIVTNAFPHIGAEVILKMDIRDFFTSTTEDRLRGYLYGIGWDQESADVLVRLCTHSGSLPQGAPTSPRLSNLINYEMDTRLDAWAKKVNAVYTRYADDITFSFRNMNQAASVNTKGQNPKTLQKVSQVLVGNKLVSSTIRVTKKILGEYGYSLHMKKKLHIRRRHQQQRVTGLVVNEKIAIPRKTRRWLRAVQQHLEQGKPASLNEKQLAGWQAFQNMIDTQYETYTREMSR